MSRSSMVSSFAALAALAALVAAPGRAQEATVAKSLHELEVKTLEGEPKKLSDFKGKVLLVVNVASECGLTPQYRGLQALHDRLKERGFSVLGFPSNEFGGQEPGDAKAIRTFCEANYKVTFPLFEKVETKAGAGQSPVYKLLQAATNELPGWNFGKYLVDKEGKPVRYFGPRTAPDARELVDAIEAALGPTK